MKKKILLSGEFSGLATGFATYQREIMKRLHATGKYDLAEFAAYISADDPKTRSFPWKIYGNAPTPNISEEEQRLYASNPGYQWGALRFEEVLLDFKPDIVFDIRDPWMMQHVITSPLREYFNLVLMPTVDSNPQQENWLSMFSQADSVFAYCDYGADILRKEGGGKINVVGAAPPGTDMKVYRPLDRKNLRQQLGVEEDCFIIGSIMRNQIRKLYPDLFESFKMLLGKLPSHQAAKTYLYVHVSYPDVGWDIPFLLKEHGLGSKVLFTYACRNPNCQHTFPSFFRDAKTNCPKCGQMSALLPTIENGVNDETMVKIYNLMDVYVQYAICEGFGMPQVEAAACGTPLMSVDYSAMYDIVRKVKGYPIKVIKKFLECATHAYRVYPDNNHLVEELAKFINLPSSMRIKKGLETRKLAEKYYDYDKTAKEWEAVFDSLEPRTGQQSWDSPPKLFFPTQEPPHNLEKTSDFVRWCLTHILGKPEEYDKYLALRLIKDINYGASTGNYSSSVSENSIEGKGQLRKFTPEDCANQLMTMRKNINGWEQRRTGMINPPKPYFIEMAKR